MKKGKSLKSVVAILLTAVMIATLAACGGGGSGSQQTTSVSSQAAASTQEVKTKEPVTLQILWPESFNLPGVQTNPIATEIQKQLGITMDIVSDPDGSKWKTYLASGDLPDIAAAGDAARAKNVYDAKAAISLNDLLKSGSILDTSKIAMDTINNKIGNTDGNYYFIPTMVNPKPGFAITKQPGLGIDTRWDLYKSVGAPEMTTEDDYLNMLAQIVKANPKAPNGKKTLGLSAWNDPGMWCFYVPYLYWTGFTELTTGLLRDPNDQYVYRWADNGPFFKAMVFLNKANRLGLFDIDSFTQTVDDMINKCKEGQLITGPSWISFTNPNVTEAVKASAGFEDVPTGFSFATSVVPTNGPAGSFSCFPFISKNCKTPERAMELLNYFHSYAGSRTVWSGVQGQTWDTSSGKPGMTTLGFSVINNDKDYNAKTGIDVYVKLVGFDQFAVDPNDGEMMNLRNAPQCLAQNLSDIDKDYSQHYGGTFPGDALDKLSQAGKVKVSKGTQYQAAFATADPEDVTKTYNSIRDYLAKNFSKLILAKDEAAFNAELKKEQAEIDKLGRAANAEYYLKAWNDATDAYNKVVK